MAELSIGEVADRTSVSVPTLRMWEERHGFPRPERLASGHRRYRERDCAAVAEIVRLRASGLSLPAAVERVRREDEPVPTSLLVGLRARRSDLAPWLVRKAALVSISRAIEDECAARAAGGVLIGAFQRERFYRAAESRWRELARTTAASFALAEFERPREPAGAPAEIPLEPASPAQREWAIVWDAADFGACLVAWERPGQEGVPDAARTFEAFWAAEPEIVRKATLIALGIVSAAAPELAAETRAQLEPPASPDRRTLRAVSALTNRIVSYLA